MKIKQIDKIYFMVHPVCYSRLIDELVKGRTDFEKRCIMWCIKREHEVRQRQDELIRNLNENEALVLYPIGSLEQWPAMLGLEKFVRQILGERCIVLPEKMPGPHNLGEWAKVNADIKTEIANEIVRMYDVYFYDWEARELKTIIFSRGIGKYRTFDMQVFVILTFTENRF